MNLEKSQKKSFLQQSCQTPMDLWIYTLDWFNSFTRYKNNLEKNLQGLPRLLLPLSTQGHPRRLLPSKRRARLLLRRRHLETSERVWTKETEQKTEEGRGRWVRRRLGFITALFGVVGMSRRRRRGLGHACSESVYYKCAEAPSWQLLTRKRKALEPHRVCGGGGGGGGGGHWGVAR